MTAKQPMMQLILLVTIPNLSFSMSQLTIGKEKRKKDALLLSSSFSMHENYPEDAFSE